MSKEIIRSVIDRVLWTAGATEWNRDLLAGAISEALVAAPQVVADEQTVLSEIADLFSIGVEARKEPGVILANVRNTVKFANLLHAVEREFFMSPDGENECLVNCWGSTTEQYLTAMRAALQAAPVQPVAVPDGWKHWCETCEGVGTIDETLGGEHFSNPKAECPDCDGNGYWVKSFAAPAAQGDAKELTDDEIVQAVRSVGVDTHPSKFGFKEQIDGMSVPVLRQVIAAIAAKAAS